MIPVGLRLVQAAHTIHPLEFALYTCKQNDRCSTEISSKRPFGARSAPYSQRGECPKIHDAPDGSGRRKPRARRYSPGNGRRACFAVKLFALMVVGWMVTFSDVPADA